MIICNSGGQHDVLQNILQLCYLLSVCEALICELFNIVIRRNEFHFTTNFPSCVVSLDFFTLFYVPSADYVCVLLRVFARIILLTLLAYWLLHINCFDTS